MFKTQFFIVGISLLLFMATIALIKNRKLREEYAIVWLIAEVMLFIFGLFPALLTMISELLGVYYLTAIFLIAFLFLLIVSFYYSIILSRLTEM
ncbi:MAG: DUF2304 domain-containing protein, partial [Candidatus Omnitrophica bacterium]|nr:DUF2304 domain-containing protein [Candidatus Omnitrophota bacterium]